MKILSLHEMMKISICLADSQMKFHVNIISFHFNTFNYSDKTLNELEKKLKLSL